MLKLLDKHLEESLLVVLLSLMSLLVAAQVFMRYVMSDSLTWSEELARYAFIWATYIGVSCGVKHKAHICVDALTDKLPTNWRHGVTIVSHLLFIVFAVMVAKEGYALTVKVLAFGQKSSSLGLPMGYVYLAPTVGFGLVIVRLLQCIHQEIVSMRKARC